MIRLIVSEKPSMGRAIAAALGIPGSGRSFVEGKGVIVTWCVGHLVEALAPEGYDPALKQWRLEPLPFFPEAFKYAPPALAGALVALFSLEHIVALASGTEVEPAWH